MTNEKSVAPQINTALYPNRWIAVVRGRVVGVGLTQGQAYRAAMHTRSKDKPQLYFVDEAGQITATELKMEFKPWLAQQPLLQTVIEILQARQIEAYLVGGAVRDLLLGRESIVDLDFAVPKDGLSIARQVANVLRGAFYPLDEARGTGRVIHALHPSHPGEKTHLDFATFRGPDLEADLRDRDFTINAMALRLSDPPELIDPLQGQRDLSQGQIRAASATAFANDPARILRAVRQAAAFDFTIEPTTAHQLQQVVPKLNLVSPERQRDELVKLLNTPAPDQAIQTLQQLGVLAHILPEIEAMVGVAQSPPHHLDVFNHTLAALRQWAILQQAGFSQIPDRYRSQIITYLQQPVTGELTFHQLLPLAVLFHDSGKPLTQTIETDQDGYTKTRFLGHESISAKLTRQVMNRFRFSSQASIFVEKVVANHMRPLTLATANSISRRASYRFFRDTHSKGVEAGIATALHALLDHQATYAPGTGQIEQEKIEQVVYHLCDTYFEQREQAVDPPPLLTGQDLIKVLDLSEGKLIGLLLKRLKEAQAIGQVQDRETALAFVQADPDYIEYHRRGQ